MVFDVYSENYTNVETNQNTSPFVEVETLGKINGTIFERTGDWDGLYSTFSLCFGCVFQY